MCLACEEDTFWLAYLQGREPLQAEDPAAVAKLFAAFPVQPLPMQQKPREEAAPSGAAANTGTFSCDDPTSG
jgi:hypothetical protein